MMRTRTRGERSIVILPLIIGLLASLLFAQTTAPVPTGPKGTLPSNVETLSLNSKLMARPMSYRVITPTDYRSKADARYPTIYLLHGLTGHYDNWTDKTSVAQYSANLQFIIVTPEGGDGWYTDSVLTANDKYESYIIQELIPEIDRKYRTIADREHRFIAGLSMGGYGAVKFGLKYPDRFTLTGTFSGAMSAGSWTEKNAGSFGKTLDVILGAEGGQVRKDNDLFGLIRAAMPEAIKAMPFIYVSCGTEDFLFQNNRDFMALLVEKKVPHEYRQHPGGHDWRFWDAQVKEFLQVAERRLKK